MSDDLGCLIIFKSAALQKLNASSVHLGGLHVAHFFAKGGSGWAVKVRVFIVHSLGLFFLG